MVDHEDENLAPFVGVVEQQAMRLCPRNAAAVHWTQKGRAEVMEVRLACGRQAPFRIEWASGEVSLVVIGKDLSETRLVIGNAGTELDAAKLHVMLSCFLDQVAVCEPASCPVRRLPRRRHGPAQGPHHEVMPASDTTHRQSPIPSDASALRRR